MKKIISSIKSIFSSGNGSSDGYGTPGEGKSVHISIVTAILLLLVWYLSTEVFRLVPPLFLPSPIAVMNKFTLTLFDGFGGSNLLVHTAWSMFRVFSAFFLACATAIPIGILMGVNRYMRGIFDPPIEFYRPIPPLAYLPLVIIWLGIDEAAKISIIYLAIFAPMVLNTRSGVKSVAIEQIHAAYSMGASKWQVLTKVILKAAMPEILTGMRIGIGFGWTTLVAAELVAAEKGLGFVILSAANFLATSVVVMGIVVIGVIAYSFDLLMRYIEKVVVPWKGKV